MVSCSINPLSSMTKMQLKLSPAEDVLYMLTSMIILGIQTHNSFPTANIGDPLLYTLAFRSPQLFSYCLYWI